jgi:transcriptional regulator with XRE-family HTH domain
MTRQEFCENLVNSRKASGVKMKDICFSMNTMPSTIYRLENGKSNFSIDNVFSYLKAIKCKMYIIHKKKNLYFKDRQVFSSFFKELREKAGKPQREFAVNIGISYTATTDIEYGTKNTSIDIVLLVVEKLEGEIILKNIKNKNDTTKRKTTQ